MGPKIKGKFLKSGLVVGVDEAGRGPLAGPVTLACVLCSRKTAHSFFRGIKDSKHLTLKGRLAWFEKMKNHPKVSYNVTSVGPSIIDRRGISKAIRLGISRLIRKSYSGPYRRLELLLDGSLKAPANYPQKTIIKGDEKVPIISAASVVAKVFRDRKMIRLSRKFPHYALEIHKGYGTKLHYQKLKKHGPSPIHRRSFLTGHF